MALEEHGKLEEKLSEEKRFEDRDRRKSSKELPDEVAGEREPAPKRLKSEDDGAARDPRRDSSRHRSSPERWSREKERHGRGREHRDDERSRKDGGRGKERDREKERNKERDRDRNKERNRERENDRHRDRERSKDRDREGYRYREKEWEKIRERDREREHERSRHSRNFSEKRRDEERDKLREKSKDREVNKTDKESIEREQNSRDPQRNQRTVFAYQLSLKAGERDLYEFFSKAGKVRDVHLMMDHSSRCSKGVGCIEFYDIMSVPMAMALSGQLLLGQPVLVKPSESQKSIVQSSASIPDEANGLIGPYPEIAEEQTLQVSTVSEQVGMQESGTNVDDFNDDERGGAVNTIHGSNNELDANPRALATGVSVSLAHNSPALNVTSSGVLVLSTIGIPSECLLLKNVFDPSTEAEPDFELDIKEDIEDECSRFGQVKHMFVDKNSAGFVYLRFDSAASAINAQRALHGRWFAGKMVTASFMLPQTYSTKFPSA